MLYNKINIVLLYINIQYKSIAVIYNLSIYILHYYMLYNNNYIGYIIHKLYIKS